MIEYSTEPPTTPGYYWVKFPLFNYPKIVNIRTIPALVGYLPGEIFPWDISEGKALFGQRINELD